MLVFWLALKKKNTIELEKLNLILTTRELLLRYEPRGILRVKHVETRCLTLCVSGTTDRFCSRNPIHQTHMLLGESTSMRETQQPQAPNTKRANEERDSGGSWRRNESTSHVEHMQMACAWMGKTNWEINKNLDSTDGKSKYELSDVEIKVIPLTKGYKKGWTMGIMEQINNNGKILK